MNVELVEAVKAHALAHYEDGGWDVVVECWEDREIADHLDQAHFNDDGSIWTVVTAEDAIRAFEPLVDVWADRQADARNSAF